MIEKRVGKDGKAVYLVRIHKTNPETGVYSRVRIPGTFTNKKDAERAEREAKTSLDKGQFVDPSKRTVADVLTEWLEIELPKNVRPENRPNYINVVHRHLIPSPFGNKPVQALRVQDIERFYAAMQAPDYLKGRGKLPRVARLHDRPASTSLIAKCHQRLNSALDMAVRFGYVERNVAKLVKPPKIEEKNPEVWSRSEVATFLAMAEADHYHPYWLLAIETGARTSELLGLSWDDFDPDRGTLTIGARVVRPIRGGVVIKENAKTAAGYRTLGLTANTVADLKRYRLRWAARKLAAKEWDSQYDRYNLMFSTGAGRPLHDANVGTAFIKLIAAAGIKRITPHGLRKTAITHAIEAGAPIKAVAARAGHSNIQTTLRTYTSLTPEMDADLMRSVEERMQTVRGKDVIAG